MAGVIISHLGTILCAIRINFVCFGEKFWPLEPVTIYTWEVVRKIILRVFTLQGVFKDRKPRDYYFTFTCIKRNYSFGLVVCCRL
jgi:hypothetical protein